MNKIQWTKQMKTPNTIRNRFSGVLLTAILLTANTTSAQEPKTRAGDGQGTVSPQQYFADRIQLDAGQPAVATIPELYD